MLTDKELKKKFREVVFKNPEKFYPVRYLEREGFYRNKCVKCSRFFWSRDKKRDVCGDAVCSGGFRIAEGSPAKNKLSFQDVWELLKKMFSARGYKPINRYPVVSRWNPTTEFTMASIAAFQPWVINGESKPPAKKLVIPQFCLRFGDVDNVGITGSHCTGFVMIGQHAFVEPSEWKQEEYFKDIYDYLILGVGLDKNELILHEDVWAGGGNYGPCIEFFSRGIELFNQVYMMYQHSDAGDSELKLKVLDMGLGMERIAWFSQGTPNMYEAIFPKTLDYLKKKTKVQMDFELYKKFSTYSAYLNIDEAEDIDAAWKEVADKLSIDVETLKERILPMTAIYSIAEHTRSLLFAITDGGLPGNVGGGYNLRIILRRALNFIDKFGWNISLYEVCEQHAKELKELYPELSNNLDDVKKILDFETNKFKETKARNKTIIENVLKKNKIDEKKLLELYDSHGIQPEQVKDVAKKMGINVDIPENFFGKMSERHLNKVQETQTKKEINFNIEKLPKTKIMYYDDYSITKFKAKVLSVQGNMVALDQTIFYPTSGGQIHDLGYINKCKVIDVVKKAHIVVHVLEKITFKEGDNVEGEIDWPRRLQLTQHHTATHILNGAARKILGEHVWQAGAAKALDKARLDITHFESLNTEDIEKIEKLSNDIIQENRPVYSEVLPRDVAEARYGFRLYQGGAVPGREIRVINIKDHDVEACGGTHLKTTEEAQVIKILKTSKIQDGLVRIEFCAGKAALEYINKEKSVLEQLAAKLNCDIDQIPSRCEELFLLWKKAKKSQLSSLAEFKLISEIRSKGDILNEASAVLRTQPEHLVKTVERFLNDIEKAKEELK